MSDYTKLTFIAKTPSPQSAHLSKSNRMIIPCKYTYNSVMDVIFSLENLYLYWFRSEFEFLSSEWIFKILKLNWFKSLELRRKF